MILTLDVGNSHIYGGVFEKDQIKLTFRKASKQANTSDELGLFLKGVLRENDIDYKKIDHIAICSVVPDMVHSLRNCSKKYFNRSPFILQAGARTGLKIKYKNPLEVGADRIANCIAVSNLYPKKNAIVIDYGTATTFDVLTAEQEYLGGAIIPGLRISMEALESRTAKLPSVEILSPSSVIGKTTVESIQSGLFFGNLTTIKGLSKLMATESFKDEKYVIVGTGGFSRLFEKEKVFDATIPDLVLKGLYLALKMNL